MGADLPDPRASPQEDGPRWGSKSAGRRWAGRRVCQRGDSVGAGAGSPTKCCPKEAQSALNREGKTTHKLVGLGMLSQNPGFRLWHYVESQTAGAGRRLRASPEICPQLGFGMAVSGLYAPREPFSGAIFFLRFRTRRSAISASLSFLWNFSFRASSRSATLKTPAVAVIATWSGVRSWRAIGVLWCRSRSASLGPRHRRPPGRRGWRRRPL